MLCSDAMSANQIRVRLKKLGSPEGAEVVKRDFKTGPGQYAEGDRFYGNTVGQLRRLAREYRELAEYDVLRLLVSPFHEERLVALLILIHQFDRGDAATRR